MRATWRTSSLAACVKKITEEVGPVDVLVNTGITRA
jgi:hypothetical protein